MFAANSIGSVAIRFQLNDSVPPISRDHRKKSACGMCRPWMSRGTAAFGARTQTMQARHGHESAAVMKTVAASQHRAVIRIGCWVHYTM